MWSTTVRTLARLGLLSGMLVTISHQAISAETIDIEYGDAKAIKASKTMINEIVIPYDSFKHIAHVAEGSTASVEKLGSSIFVSTGDEPVVSIVIKDNAAPSKPGITVILHPAEIPGQHIVLKSKKAETVFSGSAKPNRASDYVDYIRETLREAAKLKLPSGFANDTTFGNVQFEFHGHAAGRLKASLVGKASNSRYFLEAIEIVNTGSEKIELDEKQFHRDGVRGITFINGNVELSPGENTVMVWLKDR